jgi:glutamate-1-semialdehyde 2,1-aminomutase
VDPVYVSTWPDLTKAGPDDAPLALPGTGGLDPVQVSDTLVLPFNDVAATRRLLEAHGHELAAICVEPAMIDVGYIPAEPEYLALLREMADASGALLLFDELLTGFRLAPGGAQEKYGITADLVLYGKALGNGYPVAALGGKAALLEWSAPGAGKAAFVGTFNGHAVVLAAVEAALQAMSSGEPCAQLQARTEQLIAEFGRLAARHGVAAQMQGAGGHIHWYFTAEPVRTYRQAARGNARRYGAFIQSLAQRGFLVFPNYLLHHAISLAHDEPVLDELIAAFDAGLAAAATIPD